jgi:sugar O-acyltransferase (sialic acid O-acetyltransferase NeuD family)
VTDVIVVGGGDQGRQVISAIEAGEGHRVVGVLDRAIPRGTVVAGSPVLGTEDDLGTSSDQHGARAFVVAIGDNATRGGVLERLEAACPQLSLFSVIHPAASVARDATVGAGSIVLAGAVVSNACTVGRGALLGTRSSIDHDCVVGDYASLAPGVTTGGAVRIGRATALGVGANVVHGVTIGDDTVVGAGALVLGNIPEGVVAYGVPAVVARSREPGEPYL